MLNDPMIRSDKQFESALVFQQIHLLDYGQ